VVHGGIYPDRGSYAEYLKIDGDLAWRVPNNMSDETASTFGVSATSAMQALHLVLKLPWPDNQNHRAGTREAILIYSGATAALIFAIQLAKIAGYLAMRSLPHAPPDRTILSKAMVRTQYTTIGIPRRWKPSLQHTLALA
jgi:NADPH:quinone reductase-like Zn-dependent oxidoreductase